MAGIANGTGVPAHYLHNHAVAGDCGAAQRAALAMQPKRFVTLPPTCLHMQWWTPHGDPVPDSARAHACRRADAPLRNLCRWLEFGATHDPSA